MSFIQLPRFNAARALPALAATLSLLLALAGGCSSHGGQPQHHPDGGAAGNGGSGGGTPQTDAGADHVVSTCGATGPKIETGKSCGCDAECDSGYCVEGVCCATACAGGCATCSLPSSPGTCVMRSAGSAPRTPSTCPAAPPTSCGLDGFCDGAGGCRKYAGNTCMNGTCSGDAVVGAFVCDGTGQCKPGVTLMLCVPYTCNAATGTCYEACDSAAMCQSGGSCEFSTQSCGKAQNGQPCTKDTGCISNHCVDRVCCNSGCTGACTACNLPGRLGTCLPVDAGKPDPRALCKDQGTASCGHNGTCDGVGGCASYARDTQCLMPSCTGNRLNTAGTCDGLGTCRAPGVQDCHPFRCLNGACTDSCETDIDCDTGAICQANHTCGPKPIGFVCTKATECASGFCVDGVCCENACTGTCQSCALPTSPGHCLMVAAHNPDPRGACQDTGAPSCGTNGKCDGTGGCEKYPVGTVCASEKCESDLFTGASTCNATGQCVAPDARPCVPYVCNGSQCFGTCATDDQCKAPNSCIANSCGLKGNGAACSAGVECQSSFCAQGFCCNAACDGKCQSCGLPNTQGTCTNVPIGSVDPATVCTDQGPTSCGTNGKCDGNGACQLYLSGTTCQGSTCPSGSTTFTAASSCDGAGQCLTPNPTPCFPYQCGTGVCKNSCVNDADCASPAVCINGSCGLKGNGQSCATAVECLSGFCAQGVCCATGCQGACQSCALPNALGACTNVPDGATDPQSTCHDMGNASCGTDGFCNGSGACRLYAGGTSCAPPSCPTNATTLTSGRTCDGQGTCQPATTIACAPYVCNGTTACKAACSSDADCQAPDICDPKTNLCGNKKRLGQPCTATTDCLTGNSCVDGVCCSATACPTCQACNVTGSAGNCANVSANTPEPHSLCTPNAPCGNTGACDGAGHCQLGGTTVSCGNATCTGSTFTPISHCNGAGACAAPSSSSCAGNFQCGTNNACLTTCTKDQDCVAPFTCQGSGTTKSCALKPNGQTCTAAGQCISGFCTDGVCCGTNGCGTCQACNLNGMGSCAFIPVGTPSPGGQCPLSGTCGNTGTCNGSGACTQAAASVVCGTASCTGASYTPAPTCTGTGSCGTSTATTCGNYVCGTGSCKTSCSGDTDCAAGNYCTGIAGSCVPVKGNGGTCGAAHECGSGNCLDGVCCSTASCGTCQACNLNGLGTCASVGSGVTEPHARCAANGTCGNTGTCNGSGACTQAPSSVMCVAPSCTGGVATAAAFCTGTGSCATATVTNCTPFVCGTTACKTTCGADTDCVSGDYCTGSGGSCLARKGLGMACGTAHECGSGNCVDGVCCSTASCATCQACNLDGLGTCSNIGAGQPAPAGQCAATTNVCGFNATCNGSGACTLAGTGTTCTAAVCAAASTLYTPAATCDGSGTCGTPATVNCAPYNCTLAGCPTTCNTDGDCMSGDYCTGAGGSCVPRSLSGVTCSADDQCQSGHCLNGFCCGSATCPSCQSCGVTGFEGTCTNVPAGGADPTGLCPAQPAATCGTDGLCDGSGGCQDWPATTRCSAVTCAAGTSTQIVDFCNGAGACANLAVPIQDCAPLTCDAATGACL